LVRIRRIKASDFRSIIRLTNEERWGFGIRDIKRMMAPQPGGCLVAVLDKHLVGFTTAISYGRELAWIGNVVVHRKHRRGGIGSNLVQSAIGNLLRSRVKRIGLYSYPENRPMYERLNFRTTGGFVRLSISRRTGEKMSENGEVPFREILWLDKHAFGADRTRLLQRLLREFPKSWTWIHRGPQLSGYSVVKQYQDSSEIGPSVSKEMGHNAIAKLLQSSIGLASKWPLELSVPESNERVLETAGRLGFRVDRKGLVMSYASLDTITVSPAIVAFGFLDKG
jgi:GNAT superfamily N-acetyltransferase